jgi:hypothetical protein
MGRSLGRGMREFRDSVTGRLELEPAEEPAPTPALVADRRGAEAPDRLSRA